MVFTTTSPISGSIWDGPSGSPILAASNWNTQVINNLAILAAHNHSGSAGEGQIISTNTLIASPAPTRDSDYFSGFFPTASTDWKLVLSSNWFLGGFASTCTQNATISYDVYLRPGQYRLGFLRGQSPSHGIITACIDGSAIFTSDGYNINSLSNQRNYHGATGTTNIGDTFSIKHNPVSGSRLLTFAIDTKNDSSEGYITEIVSIAIDRTGEL